MKNINITLQPLSLLVGAAIVGLSLVTTGAFTPQGSSSARDVNTIAIEGQHNPRDVFFISEGTPYTVPSGKVVTLLSAGGVGNGSSSYYLQLGVNALPWNEFIAASNTSFRNLPLGLTFSENTSLSVTDGGAGAGNTTATVSAYLTDA